MCSRLFPLQRDVHRCGGRRLSAAAPRLSEPSLCFRTRPNLPPPCWHFRLCAALPAVRNPAASDDPTSAPLPTLRVALPFGMSSPPMIAPMHPIPPETQHAPNYAPCLCQQHPLTTCTALRALLSVRAAGGGGSSREASQPPTCMRRPVAPLSPFLSSPVSCRPPQCNASTLTTHARTDSKEFGSEKGESLPRFRPSSTQSRTSRNFKSRDGAAMKAATPRLP